MNKKNATFKEYYQKKIANNPNRELEIQLEMAKADIAEVLVMYREKRGFTQGHLADEIGVTQQVISRVESGSNNITIDTLLKILSILSISLKVHIAKRSRHQKILQFV